MIALILTLMSNSCSHAGGFIRGRTLTPEPQTGSTPAATGTETTHTCLTYTDLKLLHTSGGTECPAAQEMQ